MDTFTVLQQLTEAPGPAAKEKAVADTIATLWRPLSDDLSVGRTGTLVARKAGSQTPEAGAPRLSIMLAAHMDEIALLVARLVEHRGYGFIRATNVGGVDGRHLIGQTVVVHGTEPMTGVIGALPNHMLPEKKRGKTLSYEDFAIDTGLTIEQLRERVSIGDFITFRQPLRKLGSQLATGKALDNRASVVAVTVCLEALQSRNHAWDVFGAATSQEETRLLGATNSAFDVRPDLAIAIDVSFGKGPGASGEETFDLGSGPILGIGANVHRGLYDGLKAAAGRLEMKVETEPHAARSGTDAQALQTSREGIPTGLVGIPLRYMHTMVETVDLRDIERAGRLLAEFIAGLDERFIPNLRETMLAE